MPRSFRTAAAAAAVLLSAALGCGGDDLVLPSEGQPAAIAAIAGDDQAGTVGEALPGPLTVKVTDSQGRPVARARVTFVPIGEGAAPSLAPTEAVTGENGVAVSRVTLATIAGPATIEARVGEGGEALAARFTVTGMPAPAARLVAVSGDAQTGAVGAELPQPLVVRVEDEFGNGVGGTEVTWAAEGGGSVNPASGPSGADGTASAVRALDSRPGAYGTTAAAAGLAGSPVGFTSTATTGPTPRLVLATQPSATARSGIPFERQPVVQLQDDRGAPIAQSGVVVSAQIASGGGTLTGTTTRATEAAGQASFTDLAIVGAAGSRTLIFAASGFAATQSSAIVVEAGQPASVEAAAGNDQTAAAGTAVATKPAVLVEDASGTPVPGVAVTFEVTAGGGSVTGGSAITNASGGATVGSWTLGTTAGANTLRAGLPGSGVAGNPVSFAATGVPGAPSDAESSVSAEPVTIAAATQVTVTVIVRDQHRNLVSGAQVTLAASGGGNSLTQPAVTGIDGGTAGGFSSTEAGPHTITATVGSVMLQQQPTVTVTAGPPHAATSGGSVPPGTSGVPTEIRIELRDEFGNPVAGSGGAIQVQLSGPNKDRPLTPIADVGGGAYTTSYTPQKTGTDQVAIRVGGAGVAGSPFSTVVAAGPPSAVTTTVELPQHICFSEKMPILVVTKDAAGNLVERGGAVVTVSVDQSGTVTQVEMTDVGDGTYTGSYTPRIFGRLWVDVRLAGTPIKGSPFRVDLLLFC